MRRCITLLVGILLFTLPLKAQEGARDDVKQMQKLHYFFHYLRNNYVDDVPLDTLVEAAITSTLEELDPHSTYVTAEQMNAARNSLRGNFSGVGISYIVHQDTVFVRRVVDDGPASKAGIIAGDRIIGTDSVSFQGMSNEQINATLRGPKSSKITLKVKSVGSDTIYERTLTRNNIPLSSIESAYRIDEVGYIRISNFSHNTAEEFAEAYKQIGSTKHLVVDVRGNSGGSLASCIRLCELFLRKGDIIVTTEGRTHEPYIYAASKRGAMCDIALVILTDEQTASASEIFAGAMQDHDRGVVIGRRSFGKGLVQRQVEFPDGSGIRLTVSRYKTPSGRIIQRHYDNGKRKEYYSDTTRFSNPSTLDTISQPAYRTIKNGRKIYGGGGITPDEYIDLQSDESIYTFTSIAAAERLFDRTVILMHDSGAITNILKRYPTLEAFDSEYNPDEVTINFMRDIVVGSDNAIAETIWKEQSERAATMLKAILAKDLYYEGAYYYVYNRRYDNTLNRAFEVVRNDELMDEILDENQ